MNLLQDSLDGDHFKISGRLCKERAHRRTTSCTTLEPAKPSKKKIILNKAYGERARIGLSKLDLKIRGT